MLDRFVSVFHARIVRFSVHLYSIISVGTNEWLDYRGHTRRKKVKLFNTPGWTIYSCNLRLDIAMKDSHSNLNWQWTVLEINQKSKPNLNRHLISSGLDSVGPRFWLSVYQSIKIHHFSTFFHQTWNPSWVEPDNRKIYRINWKSYQVILRYPTKPTWASISGI